jgi:hypothetical protein
MWWMLLACAPRFDLHHVPVEGGSTAQRAAVDDELRFFAEHAFADDVVLRQILIAEPHREGAAGQYRHRDDTILLHPILDADQLREVLRHELCHALDESLGRPSADLTGIEHGLQPFIEQGLVLDQVADDTPRARAEAFAKVCDAGPAGGQAIATPCGDEPPRWANGAADVVQIVWRDPPTPVPQDVLTLMPAGSLRDVFELLGSELGRACVWSVSEGSCVDVRTLEPWQGEAGSVMVPSRGLGVVDLTTSGRVHGSGVFDGDGNGLALWIPSGREHPRALVRLDADTPWQPARCGPAGPDPLVAPIIDGAFWMTSGEPGAVQLDEWSWPDRPLR